MENTQKQTNIIKNNFEISEIIWAGWEKFTGQWSNLLFAVFAYAVATMPLSIIDSLWNLRLYDTQTYMPEGELEEVFEQVWIAGTSETILYVLFVILTTVWSVIIGFNFLKAMFRIYDGHKYSFAEMFTIPSGAEVNHLFNYIGGYIAYMFVVLVGLIFLIIPGIYLAIRYGQVMNLIVDKKMGIAQAFTMSSKMTENIKWKLFGFGLVQALMAIGIVIAGLVALLVGVIPAIFIIFGWCTFNGIVLYRNLYEVNK